MCASENSESHQEALKPLDDVVVATLVENHREFRRFLSQRVSNEAIAEDLLQQSMARAVENAYTLENENNVVAWFYQVLRNALIDYYRSKAAEGRKYESFLQELATQGNDHVSPADDVKEAICACMNRLLPTLKPEYAELIRRVDLGEEQPQKVAAELGVTSNNLNVRLYRARQALKASLLRSCGTCTEHGCLDCTCEF